MNRVTDEEKRHGREEETERGGGEEKLKEKRSKGCSRQQQRQERSKRMETEKSWKNVRVLFLPRNIPSFLFFFPFHPLSFLFPSFEAYLPF